MKFVRHQRVRTQFQKSNNNNKKKNNGKRRRKICSQSEEEIFNNSEILNAKILSMIALCCEQAAKSKRTFNEMKLTHIKCTAKEKRERQNEINTKYIPTYRYIDTYNETPAQQHNVQQRRRKIQKRERKSERR